MSLQLLATQICSVACGNLPTRCRSGRRSGPIWKRLVRSGKTPQRVAARAAIVLATGDGKPINAIAREFGVSRPTVYLWRDRFEAGRESSGWSKMRRDPVGARRLTAKQIAAIVEATLHTTPPDATHWTVRTMAKAQGVSHAIVHRIWRAHGLQPHRVETFKLSRDPDFVKKLRDVVGVYLHPPDKALVFCVDEKPQVQALDRTEPVLPLRPGIPARQTHDYIRHGTTNLFAALNILDGTVLARCAPQKRHTEFLAFLEQLDRTVPKRREIHLILDNYGTHTHPAVEAWFARAAAVSPAFCADQRLVAQPGRTLVCGDHPQAHPPRHLSEPRRSRFARLKST